ncbi:phage tail protein [Pseudomonas sp. p1(2021b)]|uniref:phage tail protein n=1 Tax=Pseudomonas sp. p1(2021b) TaxID=2874628 RepID=UPI001CC985B5|nr:phage tail protein [Pseudomonas sp. p1(2021b)]UBM27198.1 phage tail protein [Pseudomonas sp. p1(2021b)]
MPWYRTGTVAITAGQTTVTGTGTNFSANARVGDALLGPDGNWYEVTNIASTTVLSILPAYKGTTISGGTYAITPVQGYTKTLADKFNDIANQWGSTLAGLGSVSTENVVPVAKGGTGGTTQSTARNGLGLKSAAVADIVGTVSQSGGVPTGAILEQISNANGNAAKYANGTLICWANIDATITCTATGSIYRDLAPVGGTWTFPVAFIVRPQVMFMGLAQGVWTTTASTNPVPTNTQAGFVAFSTVALSGASLKVEAIAIGRWY